MTSRLLDLEVGDRGLQTRVPVDHVVVAVDPALLVERDEDAVDRADVALVEREPLALVVAGRAEALVLLDDRRAVLLLPLPDALDELLATEVVRELPSFASSFSTTDWVAIPAWSVPRIHIVFRPRIRLIRIRASWIVPFSAWPMWRAPVTFGGGIAIE